jgi:hypothetical protein
MNKQFKELAEKAKIPEYHLEYGTELCIAPHLEKFAELLIRECVTICADLVIEYRDAAKAQRINNEDQAKALFIAQQRMIAKLGAK